ncbi:MAG: PQQ-dependent sugar dehydrogenase [Gammaproteobacteria bacterium]
MSGRFLILLCGLFELSLVKAQTITPVQIASGLSAPVDIASAGDGSGRLFILEQSGRIRIHDGQNLLVTPFLDIDSRVGSGGERGLLGIAFHPDYSSNGQFFLNYTNNSFDTVIARFQVSSDSNLADPNSEQILLTIQQPFSNHNGGQLVFGPDGYLYIGMGDGGSGGDPQNNAQNPQSLLGKMLRIDVDSGSPYAIPADNPFAQDDFTLDEIWALGLRNPFRFSFDRISGDLFIADVGQDAIEEVHLHRVNTASGENYGWRLMEGSQCFNPSSNCNNGALTLPAFEYSHSGGRCSITGGFRYRGKRNSALAGT